MDILKLLTDLAATIEALKSQLVDAQAAVDQVAKESYDKGFADGVASVVVPPSDKIYSQAEADALVEAAVAPLKEQVSLLQAQVDGIPAQIEAAVSEAVAKLKADLKAAYDAAQAAEGEAESKFDELLK